MEVTMGKLNFIVIDCADAIGLGATEVDVVTVDGYSWTNMQDVEGNEFCVS